MSIRNWHLIEEVQRKHPGWRFSLLGGDIQMGYEQRGGNIVRNPDGSLKVAEASRFPFGWRARFFGDMDPRKVYGETHAEGTGYTAEEAIADACRNVKEAL